jgi:hypothetical protein
MSHSKSFITGLAIAGLLAVGDVTTPLFSDGEHPPMVVAIVDAVLGLLTLAGIFYAWRGRRGGVTTIIVTRLLSAMSAVPAFFADGVPPAAQIAAAVGIGVTLLAVALVAPRLRRQAAVAAAS